MTATHTHTRRRNNDNNTKKEGQKKEKLCRRELLWQSFCLIWVFVSLCDSGLFRRLPLQTSAAPRFSCRSAAQLPEHMARTRPPPPPPPPSFLLIHLLSCLRETMQLQPLLWRHSVRQAALFESHAPFIALYLPPKQVSSVFIGNQFSWSSLQTLRVLLIRR